MKEKVCLITGATDGIGRAAYIDCKLKAPSVAAQDDLAAERLWQVSEALAQERDVAGPSTAA